MTSTMSSASALSMAWQYSSTTARTALLSLSKSEHPLMDKRTDAARTDEINFFFMIYASVKDGSCNTGLPLTSISEEICRYGITDCLEEIVDLSV